MAVAKLDQDACVQCGACADACPHGAIESNDDAYQVIEDKCQGCGDCVEACPTGAVKMQ